MILFFTILSSFAMSFVGKLLADTFLTSRVAVLGSFAGFQYATNPGIAFSITFPWHLQEIFIALTVILLFSVALRAQTVWSRVAFGLILGGALGNIADRLGDGVVTDFFQVGTFPIFNVADSCITIGVGLLCAEALLQYKKGSRKG